MPAPAGEIGGSVCHVGGQSPRTVIYPLAPPGSCGTIPCIGLTGVTQQIVIALLDAYLGGGPFEGLAIR